MSDPLSELKRWLLGGQRAAMATVVDVRGSAPRPRGSKLVLSERGELAGAVSGGCVETSVISVAQELLRHGGNAQLLSFGLPDDELYEVGLPCGGELDVWVELARSPQLLELARLRDRRERGVLVSLLDQGPRRSATAEKLLVSADGGLSGSLTPPKLQRAAVCEAETRLWEGRSGVARIGDHLLFFDAVAPARRLLLFGAVDYASALCRLAAPLGWLPYVIDPRQAFARPERFPDAAEVIAAWPQDAVVQLGGIDRATSVVVLSHDPKIDDAALALALHSPAGYVGAMGSRDSADERRRRMSASGFSEVELRRIAGPVGLDLGASSPEETALSILAEIVAVGNGRRGGSLSRSAGPIHTEVR
jgi:xanthine dehydrogenase accessory factor